VLRYWTSSSPRPFDHQALYSAYAISPPLHHCHESGMNLTEQTVANTLRPRDGQKQRWFLYWTRSRVADESFWVRMDL
jgi:hypothetical protein